VRLSPLGTAATSGLCLRISRQLRKCSVV
jgi:hypothetical protein